MTGIQVSIDRAEIQRLLREDGGLAELLERVLNQVLEAEITEHLGAGPHERTPERRGRRNGHYRRCLTTRVGTLELEVPRDREGRFRTELFERYQRSEKALVLTLMEMVVNGVSTRKVKRVTRELCGREFKRSTVSELAQGLDVQVEAWNERPLEGPYPFVVVDAMQIKVRRQEAVRSTSVLIAVGVNGEGYREILGIRLANSESEAGWLETFRWLKRRGLSGVEFVVSDAHEGLVSALERCFQGAIWQRCQVHFRKNVVDRALETLEAGLADATAVLVLPEKYRRRLRTTNMLERLIQEARRREKVIRIFPDERSPWRLLGALLAEQHEIWSTGRRWLAMEDFWDWKRAREGEDLDRAA